MNQTETKTWLQYEAGKAYKRRIGLYETVRCNERFYRGDQWYGTGSDNNLPKPVFNIVRRISDYLTSSVSPGKVSVYYTGEKLPYVNDGVMLERIGKALKAMNANTAYRWEKCKMDSKVYRMISDAAISGDGVVYCYWDDRAEDYGEYSGDICTEVIDNVNLFLSDVNRADIQSQEYIILSGRDSVGKLRREAARYGVDKRDIAKIVPDDPTDRQGDISYPELEGDEEVKATYLIKFWREDGYVCFEKSTRGCVLRRVKTLCRLYPVAYFNWCPTKNSFHGTSPITGIIPNQKYINRSYAMVMKHLGDTAFSKVIYDKTRIPEWSNEVGQAIAAMGTTNVSDAVSVVGVGKLADGYLDFLSNIISVTKELCNATDISLGNVTPTNTSAILTVQEAAKIPLRLVRSAFYQCIEDIANIWADMMCAYCTNERIMPMLCDDGTVSSQRIDFDLLRDEILKAKVEVVDISNYSSSVTLSILDKLLDGGHITAEQYLRRLPNDYIGNYEELIGEVSKDGGKAREN